MRRLGPFVAIVVLCLGALLAASPALAQDEGEALQGTLRDSEGEPVPGVEITVEIPDAEPVTVTTDAEGAWVAELPGPGSYTVTLNEETLPEGVALRNEDGATLEDLTVRAGQQRTAIFALGEGGGGAKFIARLAQLTLDGIKLGLIIAMTAIGLSLIFGTTGLINFAHGELVTFGAAFAWLFNASGWGPGLHLIPAAAIAVVIGGLIGGGIERGLWKPLRGRGTGLIQMFIISIGLSLFLRHLILVGFGGSPRPYANYTLQSVLSFGPVAITPRDLSIIVLSVIILLAVGMMLLHTRIGKAMRAVADNRDLAESSGIDVERVVLFVWVIGGALAALGGIFLGMVEVVRWDMGFTLLLLMFAGVILGGLGTAFGAMVGSLIVGLVAQVSTIYFPSELRVAWALLILILVLLVRPQGILGRAERVG